MSGGRGKVGAALHVGPYRLHHYLGGGGTAMAFAAERVRADSFSQPCCVKVIHPQLRQDPDFQKCLRREAAIGASLRHRNIAALREADVAKGIMEFEFIDGANLAELQQVLPERRLSAELVVYIAMQLVEAFEYAHGQDVIHRDVSTANVMITCHGEVKLLDFGVAMIRLGASGPKTRVRGTMQYMAPEHARNEHVDGRVDLFALGVICYELLAGRLPAQGADREIYQRLLQKQYPPLRELAAATPDRLADIVTRLLEPDPRDRFGNAAECFDDFALLAPPATVRRKLARLAQEAKDHAVRSGRRATVLEEDSLPAWIPARAMRATTPPTPQAELLRSEEHDAHTAGARKDTVPFSLEAEQLVAEERRRHSTPSSIAPQRRPARSARLAAVAVLSVVAVGGLTAFAALSRDGSEEGVLNSSTRQAVPPLTESEPLASGDRGGRAAQPQQGAGGQPTLPSSDQTRPEDLSAPPVQQPSSVEEPQSQPEQGVLHIGVLPPDSKVWVDGESFGESPVVARVPPGKHVIAAGEQRPEHTRRVWVRPGASRQVFIDLTETK